MIIFDASDDMNLNDKLKRQANHKNTWGTDSEGHIFLKISAMKNYVLDCG